MRGSYPLLLHQNGWGAGGCRDPTALLRSVGVDITRPAHLGHHARHDNEYPLSTFTFTHEYPQPAATHVPRAPRCAPSPHHLSRSGSASRRDAYAHAHAHAHAHGGSVRSPAGGATPRSSPRTCSPRTAYGGRRQEGEARAGVEMELQEEERGLPAGQEGGVAGRCRVPIGASPGLTLHPLVMGAAPSELSLCCSTPEALPDDDQVHQEPEPGLLTCCDAKVSCCPCCPCLGPYCPVGHMNTVFMALICSGIIIFIVLSPLLHYLIPT